MTDISEWVFYDPDTHQYKTPDGTAVSAELCDSVQSFLDVFYIAEIRHRQRVANALKAAKVEKEK